MNKLYIYAIFHANLKFSSVPSDHYSLILDRCYWPILELASQQDIKVGMEFSAFTLETVHEIDPTFVREFKKCWIEGKCDLIGSGYIQSALPTMPAEVNRKNLEFGNACYRKLMGQVPKIAYLNEQLYSSGLIKLYKDVGYEAIVMDWDNSAAYNGFPEEDIYRPQYVKGTKNHTLRLLWNSSISFQKFQQCVFGEFPVEEYIEFVKSHHSENHDRSYPIYGSDLEIFDYKPHHSDPHHFTTTQEEMVRIREIFLGLKSLENVELLTPSEILRRFPSEKAIKIETSESPLPCKKQERYNVTRWAVCGRDNVKMNTQCYSLFNRLKCVENFLENHPLNREDRETLQSIWKDLCYLCASDFRTFATDEKHMWFRNRMGQTIYRLENLLSQKMDAIGIDGKKIIINPHKEQSIGNVFDLQVSLSEGEHRKKVGLKIEDRHVLSQDDYIEYYRDGSVRSAIVTVRPHLPPLSINRIETTTRRKIKEERNVTISNDKNIVRTPNVMIQLSQKRGATIESLVFPKISEKKLIFRLPHGYFGSIRLSDGSYSGDMILHDRSGVVINDLENVTIRYPEGSEFMPIYIPVRTKIMTPLGDFWKTYRVYIDEPRVDLIYQFQLKPVSPFYFRIGNMVINPEAFDKSSLYYATVNGGEDMETYPLKGREVIHDRPVDLTVSTHHSLGATEGWITIGDQDKSVSVITDKGQLYSVPLLRYEEFQGIYFLRVSHSIGETDETAHNFWQGHSKIAFTILAHHNQHEDIRQKSIFMNQGVITV